VDLPPTGLQIERLRVIPERVGVGERAVLVAQIFSLGAATEGVTVVVSDGDPQAGGKAIDAEWLPHIRANGRHFVRVPFRVSTTCGLHKIVVEAVGGPTNKVKATTDLHVWGWPHIGEE
jgi:hypothetical protein